MKVICFGDSNTYGHDPRSWLGGRYDADSRWVDLLAAGTGWTVRNLGQNGREIPPAAPVFPPDTDLLINIVPEPFFMDTAARIAMTYGVSVLTVFAICFIILYYYRKKQEKQI